MISEALANPEMDEVTNSADPKMPVMAKNMVDVVVANLLVRKLESDSSSVLSNLCRDMDVGDNKPQTTKTGST